MSEDEFNAISQAIVKDSGDCPYVLVLHDEQTQETRLSSNLTVDSLRQMLASALSRAESLEVSDGRTYLDKKH